MHALPPVSLTTTGFYFHLRSNPLIKQTHKHTFNMYIPAFPYAPLGASLASLQTLTMAACCSHKFSLFHQTKQRSSHALQVYHISQFSL